MTALASPRLTSYVLIGALVAAPIRVARAQADDVGLATAGSDRAAVEEAFVQFVAVPESARATHESQPELDVGALPLELAFYVMVDSNVPVIRVWRRRDGAWLERRFDAPEESAYALALVAAEILEVARSGADPEEVGLAPAAFEPEPAALVAEVAVDSPSAPEASAEEIEARGDTDVPGGLAFTVGLGVEGWFSVERNQPWLVQGTLFAELSHGPDGEDWFLAGALFGSTPGEWRDSVDSLDTTYMRHDIGGRVSFGGTFGPIDTRLIGHVRAGGSIVVGRGERDDNGDERESVIAGWFIGPSVELRQPVFAGLEVFLDLSVDFIPAPARFHIFGTPVITEPTTRLSGRLGLAWRFQ